MKATEFEYRHQTAVHLLLVTACFLTYFVDRDDIIWAFVQEHPHRELLERLLFAAATTLIGLSTTLRTWARAYDRFSFAGTVVRCVRGPYRFFHYPLQLGNLLFSVGLGFLAPLPGFVLLMIGETVIFLRLITYEKELTHTAGVTGQLSLPQPYCAWPPLWKQAFRKESGKWGIFLTMIVFTVLLRDRIAEVFAGFSFAAWLLLNHRFLQTVRLR